MPALDPISETLEAGLPIPAETASLAATLLADESVSPEAKKRFLIALHAKGETVEEVTAFAQVFRGLAKNPGLETWAVRGIDIVGTGGSASGGYNISTVTSFIVAAAGVPVLKHGNRAITSKSGAADFLGAVGIQIQADPAVLQQSLEATNFCFFFAPAFHPAFKSIMPVRKALAEEGKRSIFNILGPLINPAQPTYQLLGVFSKDWVKPLADSLTGLGLKRGLAAHCALPDGRRMDELTSAGLNRIAGIGALQSIDTEWTPESQGFTPADPKDLSGGTADENLAILHAILANGKDTGLSDSLIFNAGAALYTAEAVSSLEEGYGLAREVLFGGRLKTWLDTIQSFYRELPSTE